MASEEEIIIIGGGKPRPKDGDDKASQRAAAKLGKPSDYDLARDMINAAEEAGKPIRFKKKGG